MSLAPLELVCFGPPTARLAGGEPPPEVLWRKHLGLLIYLALSPSRTRSRDHLVGLLWAERPDEKAHRALNESVLRLRQALGKDRLRSVKDALVLNADGLDVDALRFAAAAEPSREEALALVRGDFLEGFHIEGANEFDDWMALERDRYRARSVSALVGAGERRLSEGRPVEAGDAARRALALAPRAEPAVRLLMRAAALAGDAATALTAYRDFASTLQREVREQPRRVLTALADRIRSGAWRPAAGPAAEPPLVGRARIHRDALETVAQGLAQGPRALVITAAPGMGRTRLLAECVRRLALDGALVLQARPVESDQDASWSALRLLVRAGLADAPGLPAARRESLGAVAALAPELAERFPPREARDVADMATALADVLGAVAEERPLAVALDDAHWADGPSLAALGAALGTKRAAAPIVLLLTVAQGVANPPRELQRLTGDVGRGLPGQTVRLAPLSSEDLGVLVHALAPWCKDDGERDRLTRRLAVETGGSPFFAVTLLGALAKATTLRDDFVAWPPEGGTFDAPLPFSIPSLVRHAISLLVGEMGREERAILGAASVCGQTIDLDLVAHVAERSVADVERALPVFERAYMVTFDGRRYAFAAPLTAEVVRTEDLTPGERRRLERRAGDALAARTDLESRVLRAELLAHAAPDHAVYQLALDAARDAKAAGAERMERRAMAAAEVISAGQRARQ
jgi:DNA-binding SARP family transcriptional activator